MAPPGAGNSSKQAATGAQSPGEAIGDIWTLVRDYAKQETIDPLRSIVQLFKWGLAGSVLLALGVVFSTLAILRGLQTEGGSAVSGNLSIFPYVVALLVAALIGFLAWRAIRKPIRDDEAGR